MHNETAVLIVAASGRALAASARRGGFVPHVADYFGDQDTIAVAAGNRRLRSGLAAGMQADEVLAALQELAADAPAAGVVCGSGFEDRPDLIATIAERWTLLGNPSQVVARVKDPAALTEVCGVCGIPHPAISLDAPADADGWLAKRRGGAGGEHVTAAPAGEPGTGRYFQRRVAGVPISALVLANGRDAVMLGFSAQWSAPTPRRPFRYGGAVAPADIAAPMTNALGEAVRRLIGAVPLVGLNSVDFLVDGEQFWLLEINPRPGATLDIFEPEDGSLFALHVDACRGALPPRFAARVGARAACIVYAERDIASVPARAWPDWMADRSQPGTFIKAGDPLCTVTAVAATPGAARRLASSRIATILSRMHEEAA